MDSALHILSGCQCPVILNMVTERHNIASRMILKVVSKGSYGSNLIHMDVVSATVWLSMTCTSLSKFQRKEKESLCRPEAGCIEGSSLTSRLAGASPKGPQAYTTSLVDS
eukprot:1153918-Pelagomonas_calceolata.AAC.1